MTEGQPNRAPGLVIVVRHAESEHHVRGLTGGWTDTPLTSRGQEQSGRLAARLRDELGDTPIALYTSDLQRTVQTAEHIASAFGVEAIADARLREFHNGDATDMTIAEARERFPGVYDYPWGIDDRPFPNGETGREVYERVSAFVDELCEDGRVPVVVGHGGSIVFIVARWLGLSADAVERPGFMTQTTSVTTLVRDRFGRPWVERLNDVSHLGAAEGYVGLAQLRSVR